MTAEFVIDLVPRARDALLLARAVTLRRALFDDHLQIGLLVHPLRRREGRQVRRDEAKVEGQRGGELTGRSTTPGQRAKRRRCSASLRRCASGLALSQPSISSRLWRARSAESTLARAKASGVA